MTPRQLDALVTFIRVATSGAAVEALAKAERRLWDEFFPVSSRPTQEVPCRIS